MRETKLFIQKIPVVNNGDFSKNSKSGGAANPNHFSDWVLQDPNAELMTGVNTLGEYYSYLSVAPGTTLNYQPTDADVNMYAAHQNIGVIGSGMYEVTIELNYQDPNVSPLWTRAYVGIGSCSNANAFKLINPITAPPHPNTMTFQLYADQPSSVIGYDLWFLYRSTLPYQTYNGEWGIKSISVKMVGNTYNWSEVDLYDDLDIPITYNVADVKDITKKNSNYSLTIDIPGTDHNNQLFDEIHQIESYGSTFEMLKQYPAYIEVDANRTFEGYFKLTKVAIDNDKEISYEANLYSNIIEFVNQLGTTTLRGNDDAFEDLDFSDYSVFLDEAEFVNRFTNTTQGFGMTITNKANRISWLDTTDVKTDQAFIQNSSYPGMNIMPFYFDQLTPYLYAKDIFDRIFEKTNFTYVSDFLNNTANNDTNFDFKSIVYPYTGSNETLISGDKHSNVVGDNLLYSNIHHWSNGIVPEHTYTNIGGGVLPTPPSNYTVYPTSISFDNNVYHLADNFSATTLNSWMFVAPCDGNYRISLNGLLHLGGEFMIYSCTSTNTPGGQGHPAVHTLTYHYHHQLEGGDVLNSRGSLYTYDDCYIQYELKIHHYSDNSYTILNNTHNSFQLESQYPCETVDNINHFNTVELFQTNMVGDYTIYLEQGDEIQLSVSASFANTDSSYDHTLWYCNSTQTSYTDVIATSVDLWISEGSIGDKAISIELIGDFGLYSTFDPTCILNPNTKKIDYVNNIIKKFNLYIEDVSGKMIEGTNPTQWYGSNTFKIEPRNMYYSLSHKVKDWTDRTDVETIKFERIDYYLYDKLIFKDKCDNEYCVKDYNSYDYLSGEYGEYRTTSPYNTSDEEKTEVTTLLGETMVIPINSASNIIQFPSLISVEDGEIKDKEFSDRLWFVYNTDFANSYWNVTYNNEVVGLYSREYVAFPPTPFYDIPYDYRLHNPYAVTTTYNYCDHLNIPFGKDTADLNFGGAMWYYQNLNGTWATSNNCYNQFYKQMIDDYNNPDSRLMTCKMYLKASDIRDVLLSDTIIVNSVPYHINKIKEWHKETEPCEVELIKIIESTAKNVTSSSKIPGIYVEHKVPTTLNSQLASVKKMIGENADDIYTNKTAVDKIVKQLASIDERLKKLEDANPEPEPALEREWAKIDTVMNNVYYVIKSLNQRMKAVDDKAFAQDLADFEKEYNNFKAYLATVDRDKVSDEEYQGIYTKVGELAEESNSLQTRLNEIEFG